MGLPVHAAAPRPVARLGGRGRRAQGLRPGGLRPAGLRPRAGDHRMRRIGSRDGYRPRRVRRGGLADRVRPARRRAGPDRPATSGLAEELAQDALVAALEQWPADGVPDQPGRLADGDRQAPGDRPCSAAGRRYQRKLAEVGRDDRATQRRPPTRSTTRSTTTSSDDLLRLIFTACHPVLTTESRVALTLRLLGGLTTDEIARAFLVPEADRRASASSGPSGPSPSRRRRSSCRRRPSCRRGWPPCSRSST